MGHLEWVNQNAHWIVMMVVVMSMLPFVGVIGAMLYQNTWFISRCKVMMAALWAFFSSLIIGFFIDWALLGWLLWYGMLFVIPFGLTIYGSYKAIKSSKSVAQVTHDTIIIVFYKKHYFYIFVL